MLEPVDEGDPSPTAVVHWIFAQVKAVITPGGVATELNRRKIAPPTSRGRGWNRQTVRNMIENSAYAGGRHGIKNAHPAIVSRRTLNAAQAALRSRSRGGYT